MSFFTHPAYSQYLVGLESPPLAIPDEPGILWASREGGFQFLVVSHLEILQQHGLQYAILDDDVETGYFFWLRSDWQSVSDWSELAGSVNASLLWQHGPLALVRVKSPDLLRDLPITVTRQKLVFKRYRPVDESPFAFPAIGSERGTAAVMQTILDSVNIDQIYITEEHLSGEAPYFINGAWDSMQTRHSLNPQIFKAQDYLQMRLEELGYVVDLDPFSMGGVFYDVQFAPGQSDTGWVCTTNRIYGTMDGGNSWVRQFSSASGGDIWSLFALNGNLAYAVGDYGRILFTNNSGVSWTTQTSPLSIFHFAIFFRSQNLGWIASDNGYTFKTTNGGTSWVTRTTSTSNRLYDIFFVDDLNGWAVGRNGAIIRSTNGGETWQTQSSGTTSRLYGVHFLNPDTGFVVGWDGKVLRTTNGGTNWTTLSVPFNTYFYDIDFIDNQTGIIVGWDGNCLITINGGNNWSPAANILFRDVYGMDLVNANLIWVAGDGIVAKSDNFAASWQMQLQNIPEGSLNNVVATKTGLLYPDQYFIICAHYDDMPSGPLAPGADDNASGTAAVIEAARVLAPYNFAYSIRFLMVAGEEQGLIGSASYAANAAAASQQIRGVINMDMIAYDGNNDTRMEIHAGNMSSSQEIGQSIRDNVTNWNLGLLVDYLTSGSTTASDHASFWSVGYPAVLLIEDFQDFTPYYHTVNDRLSTLRPSYFLKNARLAIGSLAMLAQVDTVQTGITADILPQQFTLYDPYPNPFNPTVYIQYQLTRPADVRLEIYNLLGQKVQEVSSGRFDAGLHKIAWHADNTSGAAVASGIYLVRLTTGNQVSLKKVVLLR